MISIMTKLRDNLCKLFEGMCIILLTMVIFASSVQVFSRYILNNSQSWTEEFARFSFIWLTLLGAVLCLNAGSHSVISIFRDGMKNVKVRKIHEIFMNISMLLVGVIMITQGAKMVNIAIGQVSPAMQVPMQVIYIPIVISGFGICVVTITRILELLTHKNEGGI